MNYHKTMKEVVSVFKELKIQYWISFGTLLGLYREKDIIKGDNDLDFCCYTEDLKKVYPQFKKKLKKLDYKIKGIRDIKKIKLIGVKEGINIAVAGFRKKGEYRVRNKWAIPAKFFTTYGTILYKGDKFRCNYPIEEYLEWIYSDWKTPMGAELGDDLYKEKVLR